MFCVFTGRSSPSFVCNNYVARVDGGEVNPVRSVPWPSDLAQNNTILGCTKPIESGTSHGRNFLALVGSLPRT